MDSPRRVGRLTRSHDFERAYTGGRVAKHPLLVLHAIPNDGGLTRVGFSVSRKIGKAVERNRLKRLLREAVRSLADEIPSRVDLVISPRQRAKEAGYWEIRQAVLEALHRLRRPGKGPQRAGERGPRR